MPRPVRVGLIGVGRWGRIYINTLLELGEQYRLTHLATSRPENAQLVPHPVQVTADWHAVVASDCDAVVIATPPGRHPVMLEACLQARKPCIVEKPFCLDVATAERLQQQVLRANTPVLVNHLDLFHPAYAALKRLLAREQEVIRVIISEGMAWGPFHTHTSALWDWCPHDVSICLDLMRTMPSGVAALGGSRDPRGASEMVHIRLEFSGGVSAWIQAGRLSPQKRRRLIVITERRCCVLDEHAPEVLMSAPLPFADRYGSAAMGRLAPRAVAVESSQRPLASMLTYFSNGLNGGDRTLFGTQLAVDVTRVLAECESQLAG